MEMVTERSKIAFIHATRLAIDPIEVTAKRLWPEVRTVSLLDDSLESDLKEAGNLTETLHSRIADLTDYACTLNVDGILFTCSSFGDAIEEVAQRAPLPVLKPNEAMFRNALSGGARIAMIYTFEPAVSGMEAEFGRLAKEFGSTASLTSVFCANALDAKQSGDVAEHDRLIRECGRRLSGFDVILLAQFSMASAAEGMHQTTKTPVLTSPEAALTDLRNRVEILQQKAAQSC